MSALRTDFGRVLARPLFPTVYFDAILFGFSESILGFIPEQNKLLCPLQLLLKFTVRRSAKQTGCSGVISNFLTFTQCLSSYTGE